MIKKREGRLTGQDHESGDTARVAKEDVRVEAVADHERARLVEVVSAPINFRIDEDQNIRGRKARRGTHVSRMQSIMAFSGLPTTMGFLPEQ